VRLAVQAGLSLAVIGVIFFVVIPSKVNLEDVARALSDVSGAEWAALVGLAAFYVLAGAPLIAATSPGLGLGRSFLVYQMTTAVARLLPGGGAFAPAIRYRFMRGWGFEREFIAASIVTMGALNAAMWLALPVVAVVTASLAGEGSGALAVVAILAAAVLASACLCAWWAIRAPQAASSIGGAIGSVDARVRRKGKADRQELWSGRIFELRGQLLLVLSHRGMRIVAAAVLTSLSGYVVLLMALRIVGVSNQDIGWEWVLVGYSVGNILGAIPITPSGLGIADLGMASVLGVHQSSDTKELIVAALVLYRAVTFLTPIITGGVSYFLARRSLVRAAADCQAEAGERDQDASRDLSPAG
jgi:uncharacterized membrane protein YbhN (UPF0104 family)